MNNYKGKIVKSIYVKIQKFWWSKTLLRQWKVKPECGRRYLEQLRVCIWEIYVYIVTGINHIYAILCHWKANKFENQHEIDKSLENVT